MESSKSNLNQYRNYNDKVIEWLNNQGSNFSLFINDDMNPVNKLAVNDNTSQHNSNLSDESEFLSVSQKSKNYSSKEKPINFHKNRKKVYKSCVKPTKEQLKFRQLPKLFDNRFSADRLPKHKKPSKSLATLNKFINTIGEKSTDNKQHQSTDEIPFDKTMKTNSSAQHYLSPKEISSYQEPLLSSASELFSDTESDPQWSEGIDLENVFVKQKCKSNKVNFKNIFSVNLNREQINDKETNGVSRSNITDKKTLGGDFETEKTFNEVKKAQIMFRTFPTKPTNNTNFIIKAKSLKEANEIYNEYKQVRDRTTSREKTLNKCVRSVDNTRCNDKLKDVSTEAKSQKKIIDFCEIVQPDSTNRIDKEYDCNIETPLKAGTEFDCKSKVSNVDLLDNKIIRGNVIHNDENNNNSVVNIDNTRCNDKLQDVETVSTEAKSQKKIIDFCEIIQADKTNRVDKEYDCNIEIPLKAGTEFGYKSKVSDADLSDNKIIRGNDVINNDENNNDCITSINPVTKLVSINNTGCEKDCIITQLTTGNKLQLENHFVLNKKVNYNSNITRRKLKSVNKKKKQKNKKLNRSSILQSPGWSKLILKMKELNVRKYKRRTNCLDITLLHNKTLHKVTKDSTETANDYRINSISIVNNLKETDLNISNINGSNRPQNELSPNEIVDTLVENIFTCNNMQSDINNSRNILHTDNHDDDEFGNVNGIVEETNCDTPISRSISNKFCSSDLFSSDTTCPYQDNSSKSYPSELQYSPLNHDNNDNLESDNSSSII